MVLGPRRFFPLKYLIIKTMLNIQAKNTDWNRRLSLTEIPGKLLGIKSGMVYFLFEINGEECYFKCDENIFNRQFQIIEPEKGIPEIQLTAEKSRTFKKYPF